MMGPIRITCILCKQQYMIEIREICWPCSSEKFLQDLEKNYPKSKFWKNAKEFALWNLLYMPIAFFIGQKFGLEIELWWIGGGIYLQLLGPFHRWLLSKF